MASLKTLFAATHFLLIWTSGHDLFAINSSSPITWFEANSLCNSSSARGQLASSHSLVHDTLIADTCPSDDCWIGLSRHSGSTTWLWTDESSNNYTNPTFDLSLPTASQSCAALSAGPIWFVLTSWSVSCINTVSLCGPVICIQDGGRLLILYHIDCRVHRF